MVIDKMLYTFWIVVSIVLSSVIRLSCHLLMLYVVNLEITACILDLNNFYHLSENASINSLTPSFVLLLYFGATSVCISRCLAAAYSGRKCMQRYIYELLYFFLIESMYNIKFSNKNKMGNFIYYKFHVTNWFSQNAYTEFSQTLVSLFKLWFNLINTHSYKTNGFISWFHQHKWWKWNKDNCQNLTNWHEQFLY